MTFAYAVFSGVASGSHPAQAVMPGLATGTMILTKMGERAVETLQVGDKVVTRSRGLQSLRGLATSTVQSGMAVHLKANVIGRHDAVTVAPMTRFLVRGEMPQELFGQSAVMVTAGDLVDYDNVIWVDQPRVQLVHLMFDNCEFVQSAGLEVETLNPEIHAIGEFAAQPLRLVHADPLSGVQRRVRAMLRQAEQ